MNGADGYDLSGYIPNPLIIMGTDEEEESDNIGDDDQNGGKIRKSQRHTPEQIQELENVFKECPHPNEKQRLDLGQRLNLETRQIRFWFQNRRTQAKTQHERHESRALRQEHAKLLKDQERLRQAMMLFSCNICGRPTSFAEVDFEAHQLIAENTKLKQEIDQLCSLFNTPDPTQLLVSASEAVHPPSSSLVISDQEINAPPELDLDDGTLMMMNERSMFLDLAIAAMNELIMLGEMNCPFWRTDSFSNRESLNYEEYKSVFRNGIKPYGYVTEATRETGLVLMTSLALVKTLMDTNKWVNVFAPIVSVASNHNVLPTGHGGAKSGSLQLIQAEFQVISPVVPKRQVKFLRYCKELRKGLWIVVDVTPSQQSSDWLSNGGSNRLPSGLIIEDMTNGYSKVTWIEQAEYDESYIHEIYQHVVGSGIGLGAKRWLTTLQRHCESLSTLSSINLTQLYPGLSTKGATEIVKLAQRMSLSYYSAITGSSVHKWERIKVECEGQNMRLMARKNLNEQVGDQTGIVLSASTSVWFPVNPQTLFYFLGNQSFRSQWDILTCNTFMEDTIKIEKSKRHGNYVSLLKIVGNGMLVLQEVLNDASGAFVIYAPVENSSMEEVMRGENSDAVKLLPSGFSILPDGETDEIYRGKNKRGGGCLLTLGLQILVSSKPTMELTQDSVKIVEELMARTIDKIKFALHIQT